MMNHRRCLIEYRHSFLFYFVSILTCISNLFMSVYKSTSDKNKSFVHQYQSILTSVVMSLNADDNQPEMTPHVKKTP